MLVRLSADQSFKCYTSNIRAQVGYALNNGRIQAQSLARVGSKQSSERHLTLPYCNLCVISGIAKS